MEKTVDCSPLRIGIVGAGRIVDRVHLPILSAMPGVSVAGLFDQDQTQSLLLAKKFPGVHTCLSLDELLALQLDAVLVACPNYLHAKLSIAMLNAGVHVLCEKPMATTLDEAIDMVEAAQRNRRELMIAYANRFRPEILLLQELVQQGKLGEIQTVRCSWLRRNEVPGTNTWFTRRTLSGGGALIDLGSHLINIALSFCPGAHLVSAQCSLNYLQERPARASWYLAENQEEVRDFCDVEIDVSGSALFVDPSYHLFLEASWDRLVERDQTSLTLIGTRGTARIETLFGLSPHGVRPDSPLTIWTSAGREVPQIAHATDLFLPFQNQWRCFLAGIRGEYGLHSLLQGSLTTVKVIDAMYRSAAFVTPSPDQR